MSIKITIQKDLELGTWLGLGGAITEATAYNFSKLSTARQKQLLDAYYDKSGLDYRWGRISVGSNDFCLEPYEYTKRTDFADFSIEHDKKWLIPMLQRILKQKDLTIMASPWSPPSRLKFLRMRRFGGKLKPWRYGDYAKYLRKWLDAYAREGINVNYLSPQNEPHARQIWESSRFSFRAQRKLVESFSSLGVPLLLWDHNKKQLTKVADELLTEKPAHVAGLCFHWYDGTCPDQMWQVRQKYPDVMMVSSEMCCGFSKYNEADWRNDAKRYLYEILSDINCGTCAWIDWNMLLSWQGGPSYCKNYVKSPVLLNEAEDDFILTPIYDALKIFAKLFPAGSKVVRCDNSSEQVAAAARKTKSGYEAVLANVSNDEQSITVALGTKEQAAVLQPGEITKIII